MNPKKNVVRKVVMIEDRPADLFFTEECCKKLQFHVDLLFFNSGVDFFAYQDHSTTLEVHFFLIDLNNAVMDGKKLIAKLRQHDKYVNTPVIIFSTSKSKHDILQSLNLGANAYVTKPSNFEQFEETILSLFTFWGLHNLTI